MSVINAPDSAEMRKSGDQKGAQPEDRGPKTHGSWNPITRYMRWLHTMWPAGTVERLPEVQPDGSTNIPGVYVVGDLTGIPLLKFSADTGARAVQHLVQQITPGMPGAKSDALDLVII